ncbi:sulfurtransferase [Psychroserpens luteolus]|uniref:sulfurtransferase n=1 Tax=Psychroserpens luteolus TaxID=2855840 RepID=UPI001E5C2820|nr:sulfurtransferase [Psychroserpens luteolus]MCD2258965.1 sulfurtransferase [Psychroserpens luteolus]
MPNASRLVSTIVSCEWLFQNQHIEELVILDARVLKADDFTSQTYIPNSRYFDIKGKFSDQDDEFPNAFPSQEQFEREARNLGINNNSLIVVYDDKGIYWSPRVWWLFKSFGFNNIAVLDGGLPEWERHNYNTINSLAISHWEEGDFKAKFQQDKMRFFHHILNIARDENCGILDARSEDRFKGIAPEPRIGLRSGTIPNSGNLPYTKLLNGNCLRPEEELKAIFKSFDIANRSLTFSCGSGITACILALAADISGYQNISVYDGSWTEFGTLTK